jgi:hypothetical protein
MPQITQINAQKHNKNNPQNWAYGLNLHTSELYN